MDFNAKILEKYPHLADEADNIVSTAKMFYLGLKYPFVKPKIEETEEVFSTFFTQRWVLSCCEEIIQRLGFNTATGYKENGMAWTFDEAWISTTLKNLITPSVATF